MRIGDFLGSFEFGFGFGVFVSLSMGSSAL